MFLMGPGPTMSQLGTPPDVDDEAVDPRHIQILEAIRDGREELVRGLLHDPDQPPFPINSARKDGQTALLWAAERGHTGLVRLLLEYGAEVETRSKPCQHWGIVPERTPLFFAAWNNHAEAVRLLIAAGANLDGGAEGSGHQQPVSCAARLGQANSLRVLLEHGAPAEFREPDRKPSLCWAAELGRDGIVELLLAYGADVNYGGMPPLSWAAHEGHLSTVQILLAHGANLEAVDTIQGSTPWVPSSGGQTALTKAAGMGHARVVQYLLDQGAESNSYDVRNRCPLVFAARGGHFETVRVLLEHDPEPTIPGPEGLTALQVGLREFKKLDPPEWYEDMWELLEPASTRHRPGILETFFGIRLG